MLFAMVPYGKYMAIVVAMAPGLLVIDFVGDYLGVQVYIDQGVFFLN